MAYDEDLANRIRELLAQHGGSDGTWDEKAMFGGLAFLINSHMGVAVSSQGGLMVRVPREETETLLGRAHVSPMVMAGRETRGWLRVEAEGHQGHRVRAHSAAEITAASASRSLR
jgi:hypothetical protein